MTDKKDNTSYSANDLQELDDKLHYRKRPALVWGQETGSPEKPFSSMQLVSFREVIENGVDEALQGFANQISVKMFKDHSFEVFDNGRGIPTDINTTTGKSGIYQALGTLRSGRNFNSKDNKKATGTNGLGASAVTIFSKRFDVTVYRDGKQHQLSFKHGQAGLFDGDTPDSKFTPIDDVSFLKVSKDERSSSERKGWETGTKVRVWLDNDTFPTKYNYNPDEIVDRLKGIAFLVPGLKIHVRNELAVVKDEQTGESFIQEETFDFTNGLGDMIESLQKDSPLLSKPIELSGTARFVNKNTAVLQSDGTIKNESVEREIPYQVIFSYGTGYSDTIKTYVNTVNTNSHGVHLDGVKLAMVKAFNERFASMRGLVPKGTELPKEEDFLEGLTMVVSIYLPEPSFTSQSKAALEGSEVKRALRESVTADLQDWIKAAANQDDLKLLAAKVTTAAKNRQHAQNQRNIQRQKNELKQSTLPDSLVDCELSGTDEAELYICEGDSAKTSLKAARDSRVNALLGVRGRIINPHNGGKSLAEVLKSQPIQEITKALGAGVGDDFDINQVRYGKVFFAVDADVDGNAIAVGLYTIFWTLFRPMVEAGMLYKIENPLFVITVSQGQKTKKRYARDEAERDEIVAELKKKKTKFRVARLKGLGEMHEDDLEETAINPKTRIVTQITAKDMEAVKAALDLTQGGDPNLRKAWLESADIENTDINE